MISVRYPAVELRQYTLRPGRRDDLIGLFEQKFIEPQEAARMALVGQFRDTDDPDPFVWLRGFPDMEARAEALGRFYYGPVWKQHATAANATMVDSDNVLLAAAHRSPYGGSSAACGEQADPERAARAEHQKGGRHHRHP